MSAKLYNPMRIAVLNYIVIAEYVFHLEIDQQGQWKAKEFKNKALLLYPVLTLDQVSASSSCTFLMFFRLLC